MSLNQKHLGKLGKRIRRIRTEQSMSQAALAEYIGCSSAFLSYIENGKKLPSLEMLLTIANALCVTTDMLLADYLEHNLRGAMTEYSEVLYDCSEYERRVLVENAKELKRILRSSRVSHRHNRNR